MLIHIGKCGGSNITYKFRDFHKLNISSVHCRRPNRNEVIKAEHICILLRDPIDRFISIYYFYYNLYLLYKNNKEIPHKETVRKTVKLFETFPTVELCAQALTSKNTEKRCLAHSAFEILPHLVYNYDFYLSPIIDLIRPKKKLFIIRQEFYTEDFSIYYKYICDSNNIKENKLKLFLEKKRNNTDKYNHLKILSKNSIQNIKTKMKDDYIIFNKLVEYGIIDRTYFNTFK